MKNVREIGVDLEGNLDENGLIELVQIASEDKIFIFDFYHVQYVHKDNEESKNLTKEMMQLLKHIMENDSILKVFHDCRKDSLALHALLHCCPVNVFDVSALYSIIDHFEKYKVAFPDTFDVIQTNQKNPQDAKGGKKAKDKKSVPSSTSESSEDIFEKLIQLQRVLEGIKPPGLNDVFEDYKAPHGLNQFKHVMKWRFWNLPKAYFLARPIDKEFLMYSAKDVEDLIACKDNILARLKEILLGINEDVKNDEVMIFALNVSKTYSNYGCKIHSHV